MATLPLIYDAQAASKVTADTLEPVQQKTRRALQIQSSFRQQFMCKHPFLSDFHCKAEHLYAGLLEGDKKVVSYVPQPFTLRIRRRLH